MITIKTISKPSIIQLEKLLVMLLFGFIFYFAFYAGYWRHDDPTYSPDEWHEFEVSGRFLLTFLHPWISTLTGGVAFSLSILLVYILALKQLPGSGIQKGSYAIPLLLILNIPFFEMTTWSGQSLMAVIALGLPELIFRNYRAKIFAACILVWGVHPSYTPLCLLYLFGNRHNSNMIRETFLDAMSFLGGVVTAYITVRVLHGIWFGFDAFNNAKMALDFSSVIKTYKSAQNTFKC